MFDRTFSLRHDPRTDNHPISRGVGCDILLHMLVTFSYLTLQGISEGGEVTGGSFENRTSGKGPKRDASSVGQHGELAVCCDVYYNERSKAEARGSKG
jgi:hypothetical protein